MDVFPFGKALLYRDAVSGTALSGFGKALMAPGTIFYFLTQVRLSPRAVDNDGIEKFKERFNAQFEKCRHVDLGAVDLWWMS